MAPVYPWIYPGGIDPYLWRPTPGVQTLDFMPYRVDLTPFAALLSDGRPHVVALSVAGANHYYAASATLLLHQDTHAAYVTGSVLRNTLAGQAAVPAIANTLATEAAGNVSGDITTQLSRHFVIEGMAYTSHGPVRTTVDQTVGFRNKQTFAITAATYGQIVDQLTSVTGSSRSVVGLVVVGEQRTTASYPLRLDYSFVPAAAGYTQATKIHQGYSKATEFRLQGITLYRATVDDVVDAADTLDFDTNYAVTGRTGQQNRQTYAFADSIGGCYRATVATSTGVVTSFDAGNGCAGGKNRAWWFSHPDGSPVGDPIPLP